MPRPGGGPPMGQKADFAAERLRMVERLVASRYIQDPRVRDAFLAVPREAFVRPEDADAAYEDVPLPIGRGQTISAPSMIVIMLEEARLAPGDRVLEIGTGSGYHAALVARLVGVTHAPDAGWPHASSGSDLYTGSSGVVGWSARMRSRSASLSDQYKIRQFRPSNRGTVSQKLWSKPASWSA